jgi:predicted RNA binding protein YcfA (HicA-like mRNA interferase family)
MTRLPRMTGKEVIDAFHKAGFQVIHTKGSHHFLRHPDGRITVVPAHSGEMIGPGLMAKILRDCDLTREEFLDLF